jgi:polyamine oxidase
VTAGYSVLSRTDDRRQAQKYGVNNTYSNYSSIATYDETGANDYSDLLDDFENAYSVLEQAAGSILSENLQDLSVRAGLSLSGWKPRKDMKMQAVEWWEWGMITFPDPIWGRELK